MSTLIKRLVDNLGLLEWEVQVLDDAYEYVDYISLHQYFGGQEKGTEKFISQADEMTDYIRTVNAVCNFIKAKKVHSIMCLSAWMNGACGPVIQARQCANQMKNGGRPHLL